MYRISKDSRVRKSAEYIKQGLILCLKNKSMSEISVSEIANASKVSRATFYRLFDTPVDVIEYICDCLAEEAHTRYLQMYLNAGKKEVFIGNLRFMMDRSDLLETIRKSGRLDILHNSFVRMNDLWTLSSARTLSQRELLYFRASLTAIFSSILFVWMRSGRKETAEELYSYFQKIAKASE